MLFLLNHEKKSPALGWESKVYFFFQTSLAI